MNLLKSLPLLGAALAFSTPAQAWICVRRPVVVTPYVAPYAYYHPTTTVYYGGAAAPVAVVAPPSAPLIGGIYYSLPPGAQEANINGTQYYVSNNTFYKPNFGANGVYYVVVPSPI